MLPYSFRRPPEGLLNDIALNLPGCVTTTSRRSWALKPGNQATDEMAKRVAGSTRDAIGKIANPRKVWIVPDMPKTRLGASNPLLCKGNSPSIPTN